MRGRKPDFTNEQVVALVARYESGEKPKKLAESFKCSTTQIHRIVRKNRNATPLTTEFEFHIQNANDRMLFEWMEKYAEEMGCSMRQLMRLLIIKEKKRSERGEVIK